MSDLKVLKIVNKDKKYQAPNGKEYAVVNYYVSFEVNGRTKLVPIRPAFRKGYDYLDLVAETRINAVIKQDDEE